MEVVLELGGIGREGFCGAWGGVDGGWGGGWGGMGWDGYLGGDGWCLEVWKGMGRDGIGFEVDRGRCRGWGMRDEARVRQEMGW